MLQPYPFQERKISVALRQNILDLSECGTGKTLVAIETIRRIRQGGPEFQRPILIIAKSSAKMQWKMALEQQEINEPIYILGRAGKGFPEDEDGRCIIITHPESLAYIVNTLKDQVFSLVVADEVHYFKNRRAQRTRALKQVEAVRKIGLSGTPMEKSPADLWSLLNWIYPHDFKSYWTWHAKYVNEVINFFGYKEIIGGKNYEQMANEIRSFTFRNTKAEVAPELPPKIITFVPVEMMPNQAALYKKIKQADDMQVHHDNEFLMVKNVLDRMTKLQQVASLPSLVGAFGASSGKVEWIRDYVTDNPEEPIVIMTRFRESALFLSGMFGNQVDTLIGGSNSSAYKFQSGEKRLAIGTIDYMGESLNLQRAGTMIFFEVTWSLKAMTQAVDRIHRIDIREPKNIIYLVGCKVDNLILKALDGKWSQSELVYEYLKGGD